MAQESKRVAIIGAGASGCLCAYFLLKNNIDVTIFDYGTFLRTLLPTGGGRCNLAHAEYDFKELAKNYPRGEKFLYSIFSKFSTYDTLATFYDMGIETYTQDNGRIFPTNDSSKITREIILENIKNAQFVKERVLSVEFLNNEYKLRTDKAEYLFTDIVVATGGKNSNKVERLSVKGFEKHNFISFLPSLVGLNTKDAVKDISGVVIKNVQLKDSQYKDDILFTHFGISGPLIYTISSINATADFPYVITLDLYSEELDLQSELNSNPHKDIKNILSKYLPQSFVLHILSKLNIDSTLKGHKINGRQRDEILYLIHNYKFEITGVNFGEETVSAGGIDTNEINSKTMESKIYPRIYFIGEVLNIDGFCGGFNLQNAWSTAYVAAEAISL